MANTTEGKVLYKGKEGNEGKQEAARDLGKENNAINKTLESEMFKDLTKFASGKVEFQDGSFDIDKAADREAMRSLIKKLDDMDVHEQAELLGLLVDLDNLMKEKTAEVENATADTKRAVDTHKADVLADSNRDGKVGAVKNEAKYERNTAKNERVEDAQLDITRAIQSLTELTPAEQDAFLDMAGTGKYQGINFAGRMRKDYIAKQVAAGGDKKEAGEAFAKIEGLLREKKMRDDLRKLNRFEKKSDRVETRVQRAREKNSTELNLNEEAVRTMIGELSLKYGPDQFAKMLDAKLQKAAVGMKSMTPEMIKAMHFDTEEGLVAALADETSGPRIRDIFAQQLTFMGAGSLEMWLTGKKQPEKKEVVKDAGKLTAEEQKQIDDKVASMNLPAEAAKRVRPYVAGAISSYFTGLGAGVSYDLRTKMIDAVIIGAGMSTTGVPGFMVDFQKSIELGKNKGGSITGNVGLANAIIPFARVDLEKVLNNKSMFADLNAKAQKSIGVYGEVAGPYAGAGVRFESNYMKGIDKQADNINTGFNTMLAGLTKESTRDEVITALKTKFSKAEPEDLIRATDIILSGLAQDYTSAEIADAFTQAWQNEKIKKAQGHVDVTLEGGFGVVGPVPVLKAFIGLGFYRGATMKENKEDKKVAKAQEQAFDHADKIDASRLIEVTKGFFAGCDVTESGDLITVTQPEGTKREIWKQFQIYMKGTDATITDHSLTFSKNSPSMIASIVGATGRTDRSLYIGFGNGEAVGARRVLEAKAGTPEAVKKLTKKTVKETIVDVETKDVPLTLTLTETAPGKERIDKHIADQRIQCLKITEGPREIKYQYQALCKAFYGAVNSKDWNKITEAYTKIQDKVKGVYMPDLKDENDKRYFINQAVKMLAYGAKSWNLNTEGGNGKKKAGYPENLSTLMGHRSRVDATFQSFDDDKHSLANSFDAMRAKMATEKTFTEVSVDNAFMITGDYRNTDAKGHFIGETMPIGLGSVKLAAKAGTKEIWKEDITDAGQQKKLLDAFCANAPEMARIQASIMKALEAQGVKDKEICADDVQKMLNGQDILGIRLSKNMYKAFNGSCVNEGLVVEITGITILGGKTQQKKKEEIEEVVDVDHTMAVDVVTGGQNAVKRNVGLGFTMKQETQNVKNPDSHTGTGNQGGQSTSNPQNGGTPTTTEVVDPWGGTPNNTTPTTDPWEGVNQSGVTTEKVIKTGVGGGVSGATSAGGKKWGQRGNE